MGNGLGIVAAKEADFMIHSLLKFELFGQELYLTTTHVSILQFYPCDKCKYNQSQTYDQYTDMRRRKVKLQDTDGKPGSFQNAVENVVEMLDGMVKSGMGKKGIPYRNYIGTLFLFILFSNLSGLLGLRPPTADYGVTFPLGVITFFLIQFNNIRYNKVGAFTNLFKPLPFLFPINLIGEIAVPFSLSLRLFGNVLSGTVIMALLYGLLSQIAIIWPGFLHAYFDVFSGAIQTYVFCMLTMVFVSDKIPD